MIAEPGRVATARVRLRPALIGAAGVGAIVVGRVVQATRPADDASPLVIATHLYALVLLVGLLWLACALGRLTLRRCGVVPESRLEHGVFAIALGLGLLATVVIALGLAQELNRTLLALAVV